MPRASRRRGSAAGRGASRRSRPPGRRGPGPRRGTDRTARPVTVGRPPIVRPRCWSRTIPAIARPTAVSLEDEPARRRAQHRRCRRGRFAAAGGGRRARSRRRAARTAPTPVASASDRRQRAARARARAPPRARSPASAAAARQDDRFPQLRRRGSGAPDAPRPRASTRFARRRATSRTATIANRARRQRERADRRDREDRLRGRALGLVALEERRAGPVRSDDALRRRRHPWRGRTGSPLAQVRAPAHRAARVEARRVEEVAPVVAERQAGGGDVGEGVRRDRAPSRRRWGCRRSAAGRARCSRLSAYQISARGSIDREDARRPRTRPSSGDPRAARDERVGRRRRRRSSSSPTSTPISAAVASETAISTRGGVSGGGSPRVLGRTRTSAVGELLAGRRGPARRRRARIASSMPSWWRSEMNVGKRGGSAIAKRGGRDQQRPRSDQRARGTRGNARRYCSPSRSTTGERVVERAGRRTRGTARCCDRPPRRHRSCLAQTRRRRPG